MSGAESGALLANWASRSDLWNDSVARSGPQLLLLARPPLGQQAGTRGGAKLRAIGEEKTMARMVASAAAADVALKDVMAREVARFWGEGRSK
jgi:hypothetical protein